MAHQGNMFAGDDSLGPLLGGDVPDFTTTFEDSTLSIVPVSLFIVLAIIYIHNLFGKEPCVDSGILLPVKLVLGVALFSVDLAILALWTQVPLLRPDMVLASSILTCVGSLCVIAVLYLQHCRSIRPSSLLSVFLGITLLFDAAKARSYFMRTGLDDIAGLTVASAVLKFLLVALEEVPKSKLINSQQLPILNAEIVSGFWNRSLFVWLNSTLLVGFKRTIAVSDLQDLGPKFNSERLYEEFFVYWQKEDKASKFALPKTLIRFFRWHLCYLAVPRLCNSGFIIAQPLLLMQLSRAVAHEEVPTAIIGGICAATALIYVGAAISRAIYKQLNLRVIAATRGTLLTALYYKMMTLSSDELKRSAVLTLMNSDMSGIEASLARVHDAWASLLELAAGMAILAVYIGPACILMFVPTAISTTVASLNSKTMRDATQMWNAATQARVSATSDILTQILSIRISGFTALLAEQIERLRVEEVDASLKERKARVWMHATSFFAEGLSPVLVLAGAIFWTRRDDPMSIPEVFTVIAVTVVTTAPLATFLAFLPAISSGYACAHRIQQYLLLKESKRLITHDGDDSEKEPMPRQFAVLLTNATLYGNQGKTIFQNVSLKLHLNKIVMLIGDTGSGKSSLLKTMLGEQELSVGTVERLASDVGYCDQAPWLQNMSIRDNISAQNGYNRVLYNKVITACALLDDFAQLPDGDEFIVGTGGCKLSGGQKQRVALARAVYCASFGRAPLLLLDDVLSACDDRTSETIMVQLFGKDGIFRQPETKSTVVLVTSSAAHLSYADEIYELTKGGSVQKRPSDFVTAGQESDLIKWYRTGKKDETDPSVEAQPVDPKPAATVKDDATRRCGDLSLYKYYIKSIGWKRAIPWFCVMAATTAAERMPLVFVRIWMTNNPMNSLYFIGYGLFGVAAVVLPCFSIGSFYFKLVPRSSLLLHQRLLRTVIRMRLWYFSSLGSGSLMNRFSTDIGVISHDLPKGFMQSVFLFFQIPTDSAIVVSGAKYAAAFLPFIFLTVYFIQYFYLRTSRQMRYLDLEARAPLFTHFSETASGIQHIRAFRWREQFTWQCLGLVDFAQRPFYYFMCIQAWLNLVLDLTIAVIAVIVVAFALNFTSTTSQAAVGLSMVNIITLSTRLSGFIQSVVDMETSFGAVARLQDFVRNTPVEKMPSHGASTKKLLGPIWPEKGRLSLKNVTAWYNEDDVDSSPVLRDFTVKIKAGSKVGILGRTGSGKSSLMLALLNFLDYHGSIKIDGRELRTIPHEFLRSRIVSVCQDGISLSGTLRRNLDPYDTPDLTHRLADETLIDVLQRANLWSSVYSRGYNLDTMLEELKLSAGQMQLLAVARAMLRREYNSTRIVLLDEALSSVDDGTAERVRAEMASCFSNCTVITIAHRLEALEECELVLEMELGKIIRTKAQDSAGGAGAAE